jgi:predicted NBD/HSP70 family sugar kinase
MKKATRQQTREHNRNLVLKTIFEHESISRAEIARLTRLTRTTVSEIVADLLDAHLVDEIGLGSSLGGKSPILLSLLADARYSIGLDLGHNCFSAAVVNLRGQVRKQINRPVNDRNADSALSLVYEILDQLSQSPFQPLVGIGVGAPGLVNTQNGVVINAVNLDWQDLPLARLIQERYNLPVYVLNDSQAAAMGEFTYGGDHRHDRHMVVINVRHGIGAGLIFDNCLFQGDGGGAGEIGHVVIEPENGRPCRCGNCGCLETVASVQAIINEYARRSGAQTSLVSIEQAFLAGDPLAREVVRQAAQAMGRAIAALVGTLNIHKIILTGDMTRFGQLWLDAIRETVSSSSLARLANETQVEISGLGQAGLEIAKANGIILGAAALLVNHGAADYALLFRQPARPTQPGERLP